MFRSGRWRYLKGKAAWYSEFCCPASVLLYWQKLDIIWFRLSHRWILLSESLEHPDSGFMERKFKGYEWKRTWLSFCQNKDWCTLCVSRLGKKNQTAMCYIHTPTARKQPLKAAWQSWGTNCILFGFINNYVKGEHTTRVQNFKLCFLFFS